MVVLVRTEWSGTSGGPGLTQMALSGGGVPGWTQEMTQPALAAVHSFWQGIREWLPDELTLTVSPVVDEYQTVNAELINSFVADVAPVPVTGTATGTYAGGVGLKINWGTARIHNGRRVRGHTYVVPVGSIAFTNTGVVTSSARASLNEKAGTLIDSLALLNTQLYVWSRPSPSPNLRVGVLSAVTSGTTSPKSAILRGRRD